MRLHYTRINDGDLQGAFNLFTRDYRSRTPNWVQVHNPSHIHMISLGRPAISGSVATMPIEFYARDTVGDTTCRRFKGTVTAVKVEGGVWRYAPNSDKLHPKEFPNPVSDCPSL
jgi:hypothetical protein